jgi:hypothetical protein
MNFKPDRVSWNLSGCCVMTTYDPDTLEQGYRVLKEIVHKFGGELALDCYVIRGGEIRVNDVGRLLYTMAGIDRYSVAL